MLSRLIFSLPASLPDAQDGAREAPADGPDARVVRRRAAARFRVGDGGGHRLDPCEASGDGAANVGGDGRQPGRPGRADGGAGAARGDERAAAAGV